MKVKAQYIEFFYEYDEEEEEEEESQLVAQYGYQTVEEEEPTPDTGKIAALSGVPRLHTLRLKGSIQGQKVVVLVDGGATHNFIYVVLVERIKLQVENFDGFTIIIPGNNSMDYIKWIPKLQVTLGNHTITDNFYVVNVAVKMWLWEYNGYIL